MNRKEINERFKEFGVKKKSFLFLLPMINFSNISLGELDQFLLDVTIRSKEIQLVLLFDNKDNDEFKMLFWKLCNHHSYIDNSDYSDCKTELICNFNVENKDDYYKFLEGKYSQFSDKYKERVLEYHDIPKEHNPIFAKINLYDVLYPNKEKRSEIAKDLGVELKNMSNELFSIPNLVYEEYLPLKQLKLQYKSFVESITDK